MKILVTGATDNELYYIKNTKNVTVATTGIGTVATTYNLSKILNKSKFDIVLNIGIAGSFSPNIPIGAVVVVGSEIFGDFGVVTQKGFSTCFEEKIISNNDFPFANGELISVLGSEISKEFSLPVVKGITNNTVSGETTKINTLKEKFSLDIETMESAAFFYVCLCENIPFIGIRSISNLIEPRDKSKWNIPLAIQNLSEKVEEIIAKYSG